MKLLNAAYEILADPERRKAYDLYRAARWKEGGTASGASPRLRQPWGLLPLAIVIVALAFRLSPRLFLLLAPLLLALWLLWSRHTPNSS